MTQDEKDKCLEIIGLGIAEIVNNYSENALLINACDVARKRYKTTPIKHLSTTGNIPRPLRLDNEIDVVYTNADLVEKYTGDVPEVVYKNYLIVSVSLVDATLEDLYEYLLKVNDPALTDTELEKLVRNAWTNDNMINFFVNTIQLTKPAAMQTEFTEAFMRYTELRIVRHTLLHTGGKLSDKNYAKLQANLVATPDARKPMALTNAPIFDANRTVVLEMNHVLSFRQYLDRFLMYLFTSINEKQVAV